MAAKIQKYTAKLSGVTSDSAKAVYAGYLTRLNAQEEGLNANIDIMTTELDDLQAQMTDMQSAQQ